MNIKKLVLLFALFLGFAPFAGAQTLLTMTTLSTASQGMGSVNGATPTGNMSIVALTSATGVSGPAANASYTSGLQATSEAQSYLFVDRELMQVKAVSGTTITVIRGMGGTGAVSHASGALVFVIPTSAFGAWSGGAFGAAMQGPSTPQGSCTRTNELYLPRIEFNSGTISDCVGGQWVNGDAAQTSRASNFELPFPNVGFTAYTSAGTSTVKATNTMYCDEFDMPYSKYVTGLAVMNGTVASTDKEIAVLYDSTGNLIANSAVAGAVASGASTYQKRAFTVPYYIVGPAQYFACAQGDSGTTASLNMVVTGTSDFLLTKSYGSQTFGTIPSTITVPTTFTTAVGPLFFMY